MKSGFKILQSFLIVLLFSSLIFGFLKNNINAVGLPDQQDVLNFNEPGANTVVRGSINVRFIAYDDEQTSIPYTVGIYDATTCFDNFYGNINSSSSGFSSSTSSNSFVWNTRQTQTNSNLSDGNYCITLCVALRNGSEPYSACSSRKITIANNNSAPVITSTPSKLQYRNGESFSYQVQATDPNADPLTYRLVTSPGNLNINPQTGLITSSTLVANLNQVINYTAIVGVDDGINPTVTQTFTFSVSNPGTSSGGKTDDNGGTPNPTTPTTPSTPTNPNPTDPGEDGEEEPSDGNADVDITFKSPRQGDVFSGTTNLISWQIDGEGVISSIELEYSSDLTQWFEISSDINTSRNYYLWDVSQILDNNYYIRLRVITEDNKTTEEVSPRLVVRASGEDDVDEPIQSVPLIINVRPENNSDIRDDFNVAISGDFVPSQNNTVIPNTFTIQVDGRDYIENCSFDTEGFLCTPSNELREGKHVVKATIGDSSNQTAELEWVFTITFEENEGDENGEDSNDDNFLGINFGSINLTLILLVICLLGLLLFIPWLIYAMWSRGGNSTDVKIKETKTFTEFPKDQYGTNTYPDVNVFMNTPNADTPVPQYNTYNTFEPAVPTPVYNGFVDPYATNQAPVTNNYIYNPGDYQVPGTTTQPVNTDNTQATNIEPTINPSPTIEPQNNKNQKKDDGFVEPLAAD